MALRPIAGPWVALRDHKTGGEESRVTIADIDGIGPVWATSWVAQAKKLPRAVEY